MALSEKRRRLAKEIRAARLIAMREMAAKSDDAALVEAASLFDEWQAGKTYTQGAVLRHNGVLYRVMQASVASQAHQPPDSTGMLAVYAPIQPPAEEGQVLPWVNGEAGLKVGDRREYKGKVYEAAQAPGANIWAPDTVPAIWKEVAA